MAEAENTCKGKNHCSADLLFDWFGFGQTSNSTKAKQLNPNLSNRRSAVQWYFPSRSKTVFSGRGDTDSGDVADVDGEREDGRPATRVTAHSTYHWKLVNVGDPNGSLPIIFNLKIIIRISFQSSLAAAPLFDHSVWYTGSSRYVDRRTKIQAQASLFHQATKHSHKVFTHILLTAATALPRYSSSSFWRCKVFYVW